MITIAVMNEHVITTQSSIAKRNQRAMAMFVPSLIHNRKFSPGENLFTQ